ncbi:MAG TPA: hypothetical protein VGA62_12075 [Acidimicrobiia bacterium]
MAIDAVRLQNIPLFAVLDDGMFGADFAKLAADHPSVAAVIDSALAERLPGDGSL